MKYYKVMLNNDIVDVLNDPVWVKQLNHSGIIVMSNITEAMGVVSSDGEETWQINGAPLLRGKEYDIVSVVDISEEEATELKTLLGLGASITYSDIDNEAEIVVPPDPEDETPEIPDGTDEQEILTRAELTERIKELEKQNDFLEECLLEMSSKVYA